MVSDEKNIRTHHRIPGTLKEVSLLFLKLGAFSFGGPAAYIAIMQRETVRNRKWVDDQTFLDLVGATNLIPGPNATEMAIHLGLRRAGWRGFLNAGVLFILPGMLATMVLAWAYVRFGSLPEVGWVLYGIKPVVIAIILQALWDLGKKAVKGWVTALVGIGVIFKDRSGTLWQRLRTGCLYALRICHPPGLDHQSTTSRCHCCRTGHAGPGLFKRHFRRLPGRKLARGVVSDVRYLPTLICFRGAAQPYLTLVEEIAMGQEVPGWGECSIPRLDGGGYLGTGAGGGSRRFYYHPCIDIHGSGDPF
jgi:chromate transport protein ChrA